MSLSLASARFGIVAGFLNAIRHRIANKQKPEPGNDVILAAQIAALLNGWDTQQALLIRINRWVSHEDHRPMCEGDEYGRGTCDCGLTQLLTDLTDTLR